jgi:hypothetical protein
MPGYWKRADERLFQSASQHPFGGGYTVAASLECGSTSWIGPIRRRGYVYLSG